MAKKRGNNEGNINLRKDGRWEARVTIGYRNGKQLRKCIYGATREEVAKRMTTALAEVQKGNALPDEKITLKAFVETWLEGTAKPRLRQSTFNRYETLMRLHVFPTLGRIPVGRFSPVQAQKHWSDLAKAGLRARTIIQIRAILRTALNQAVRHGLASKNAASLSDAPKPESFKPAFLNPKEAEALLKAFEGHRIEPLITLALTTGMRIGEILGLTWSDIDLDGKHLTIKRQQQRVGKELIICDPKTERSARSIPLTDLAIDALKRHQVWQVGWLREGIESGRVLSGRVFTNETGAPLENATVLRQFQRITKDAKFPHMRLHDLRHSCATLLLSKGIHARVVMEILGHSTIAMTMNVYSHVVPEIAREAATAMDAVFAQKTGTDDGN